MLSIAVCDEQRESLESVKEELKKAAENLKLETCMYLYTDSNEMLELINGNKECFDIIFLDIDMHDMSGLYVARNIRTVNSEIPLIFVSAHEHYVFESLDYNPIKYIRKKKLNEEIEPALKKAYQCVKNKKQKQILLKTDSGGIVNIKYIYEYSDNNVILDNNKKLNVSRRRMK